MAPRSRSYKISATPSTIFAHLLVIAVATLVLVWLLEKRNGFAFNSVNKFKIFNLHPFFMIIGYILIGGEAIMAHKTIPATRRAQKTVHLLLHLVALLCGIVGIYVVFKFHNEAGLPNMYSLHSWLGMGTICLYGLQWLLGFFSYVFPRAETSSRASFLPWHVFFGLAIFILAICAAETGLLEKFLFLGLFRSQEALIVNFIGILLILFAISVGLTVVLPRVH
ncbi:probable ascorbate-specific transmembrane electron transporter 1 [Mangifera indica]|uniref:probable ascorbate-specific transmembrane electron transporter 1 n=1 Tax=Mangifera indica TaxID=29780 RepID=UPI001CFB64F9|nr:probable ascorbate-specific transmembrane electron transporter 1 [Mangifera indica]